MTEVISLEDIKKTQNSLSKYIKDPPLTEKLLRKPPFRFLHDIIKSVIKETGFLGDIFTADDLNLNNIKDREGKIAFLKKLILALKNATGSAISAKPNKIVAGLEVTKTLELLQAVGKGIYLKQSGKVQKESTENKKSLKDKAHSGKDAEAVKKVKVKKEDNQDDVGKKKVKSVVKENGLAETKKKDNLEEQNSKKKEETVNNENGTIQKENESASKSEIKDVGKMELEIGNVDKNESNEENADNENINKEGPKETIHVGELQNGEPIVENGLPSIKDSEKKNEENVSKPDKRPSTRRSSSRSRTASKSNNENVKSSGIKEKTDEKTIKKSQEIKAENLPLLGGGDAPPISVPKIERPATARKAPPSARAPGVPKAKDRGEITLSEVVDIESKVKPVEVITEDSIQEDDKENMVVVETQPLSLENDIQDTIVTVNLENEAVGENEGALVAQILETKKELEESKQLWGNTIQRNVEIEWESGRKQKRESWEKEVSKLRENIQELTRTTNPLGKLFDFIQEDVDSMQRELKSWMSVGKQFKDQLQQEQKLTENTLEKYKKQLAEMDSLIEQEQESVRNIKANIIANDKKIFNLVTKNHMSEN